MVCGDVWRCVRDIDTSGTSVAADPHVRGYPCSPLRSTIKGYMFHVKHTHLPTVLWLRSPRSTQRRRIQERGGRCRGAGKVGEGRLPCPHDRAAPEPRARADLMRAWRSKRGGHHSEIMSVALRDTLATYTATQRMFHVKRRRWRQGRLHVFSLRSVSLRLSAGSKRASLYECDGPSGRRVCASASAIQERVMWGGRSSPEAAHRTSHAAGSAMSGHARIGVPRVVCCMGAVCLRGQTAANRHRFT